MPLFAAEELFRIREVGPDVGSPGWANLRIGSNRRRTTPPAALTGPGLYALFFDEMLI